MPVPTVKLTTRYEAGSAWWDAGGMDLWTETAEQFGDPDEDELELPAGAAADFLVKAALIPGWEGEPLMIEMES